MEHTIRVQAWLPPGEAGRPFVTLPQAVADAIRARVSRAPSPVDVTLGPA